MGIISPCVFFYDNDGRIIMFNSGVMDNPFYYYLTFTDDGISFEEITVANLRLTTQLSPDSKIPVCPAIDLLSLIIEKSPFNILTEKPHMRNGNNFTHIISSKTAIRCRCAKTGCINADFFCYRYCAVNMKII